MFKICFLGEPSFGDFHLSFKLVGFWPFIPPLKKKKIGVMQPSFKPTWRIQGNLKEEPLDCITQGNDATKCLATKCPGDRVPR